MGELPNAVECGATQRLTLQNQEGWGHKVHTVTSDLKTVGLASFPA